MRAKLPEKADPSQTQWTNPAGLAPYASLRFVAPTNNPFMVSGNPVDIKGQNRSDYTTIMVMNIQPERSVFGGGVNVAVIDDIPDFDLVIQTDMKAYQRPNAGYTTSELALKAGRKFRVLGECGNFYYGAVYKTNYQQFTGEDKYEGGVYKRMLFQRACFTKPSMVG